MRVATPKESRARYNWHTPDSAAEALGVSADMVRELIRDKHLRPPGVMDVSRSKVPRYRISPEALDRYISESEARLSEESGDEA